MIHNEPVISERIRRCLQRRKIQLKKLNGRRFGDLLFDRRRDPVTRNHNDRIVSQATANKSGGMG
jgi:hypothetical protein